MNITKISYKRGATLNVGGYESVKIEIGVEADVGADEPVDEALNDMRELVLTELRNEARTVRERAKKRRIEE